jgi:deoxyribose-phosphate aldolase
VSRAAELTPRSAPDPVATAGEAARIVARATAVDAVGLEARAAALATRSIKRETKVWALDLAIRCMDLTTLEGTDTTGKVVALCAKAVRPDPLRAGVPSVAAVCLYPQLVPAAVDQAAGDPRRGRRGGRRDRHRAEPLALPRRALC